MRLIRAPAAQRSSLPSRLPSAAKAKHSKGFRQSIRLMVNYVCDPEEIEKNVDAFSNDGKITASASLRRLARAWVKRFESFKQSTLEETP